MPESHAPLTLPQTDSSANGIFSTLPQFNPLGRAALAFISLGGMWAVQGLVGKLPAIAYGINLVAVAAGGMGIALLLALILSTVLKTSGDYDPANQNKLRAGTIAFQTLLLVGLMVFLGVVADTLARTIIPGLIQIIQFALGTTSYNSVLGELQTDVAVTSLGAALLALAFLVSIQNRAWLQRILVLGGGITALSWILPLIQLIFFRPTSFYAAMNLSAGSGVYSAHVNSAMTAGMSLTQVSTAQTLTVGLSAGLIYFFGLQVAMLVEHPVHTNGRMRTSFISGAAAAGLLVLVTLGLITRMVPGQFLAAESFIQLHSVTVDGLAIPWIPYYLAIIQTSPAWVFSTTITWAFSGWIFLLVLMMGAGEIISLWVARGILPVEIGAVRSGSGSAVVAQMGVVFGALAALGWCGVDSSHLAWFDFPLIMALVLLESFWRASFGLIFDRQLRERFWTQMGQRSGRLVLNIGLAVLGLGYTGWFIFFSSKNLTAITGSVSGTLWFGLVIVGVGLGWQLICRQAWGTKDINATITDPAQPAGRI